MSGLSNKSHMDEEAKSVVVKVRNKIEAALDLFVRNRRSGTTSALKIAIATSDSTLLLSGSKEEGRKIIEDGNSEIDYLNVTGKVASWKSIDKKKTRGKDNQIIVDNSFMLRALRRILEVLNFTFAEVKRLKDINKDIRRANENITNTNTKLHKKMKKVRDELRNARREQEALSNRVKSLQHKIDSLRNGKSK